MNVLYGAFLFWPSIYKTMISLDSYNSFASTVRQSLSGKAEIFQLCVACRRGQATSIPLDYYAPAEGGWRFVKYEFFCVFFFFFSFFFH